MGNLPGWAIVVLRLVHILAGLFWVGAAFMVSRFILPAVVAAGPGGASVMRELGQTRKLPVYINIAAGLSMLSGFILYAVFSASSGGAYARSRMGMVLGLGAVLSVVAAVIGGAFIRPLGMRMGVLGAAIAARNGPPTPEERAELEQLQTKMRKFSGLVSSLLVLGAATMAVARYV